MPKKFLTPEKKEGAKRKYTRKIKNGIEESKKGSSKTSSNADSDEDIESEEEEDEEEEAEPVEVKLASAKRKVVRQKKRKADNDDYSDFSDEDKTRGWKRSIKDNGVKPKSKPGRKKVFEILMVGCILWL